MFRERRKTEAIKYEAIKLRRFIRTGRRRLVRIERAVLAELSHLRQRLPQARGALVASSDGLLVAHDVEGLEAETMAAMSAAYLGLAQQLARGAAYGEFQETVTRAAGGYVATFAAGTTALLTVLADAEVNLGLLHHEARPVAQRVGALVAGQQFDQLDQ
jgi:uncharacterized protein